MIDLKIKDSAPDCFAIVDASGALLINDIEKWIDGLVPMVKIDRGSTSIGDAPLALFRDAKTGAKFVVGRVSDV